MSSCEEIPDGSLASAHQGTSAATASAFAAFHAQAYHSCSCPAPSSAPCAVASSLHHYCLTLLVSESIRSLGSVHSPPSTPPSGSGSVQRLAPSTSPKVLELDNLTQGLTVEWLESKFDHGRVGSRLTLRCLTSKPPSGASQLGSVVPLPRVASTTQTDLSSAQALLIDSGLATWQRRGATVAEDNLEQRRSRDYG